MSIPTGKFQREPFGFKVLSFHWWAGVLYLFTEATVTAVVSVCTIALTISYSLSIFAVIIFGMSNIPPRTFSLGRLRPVINWVGLVNILLCDYGVFPLSWLAIPYFYHNELGCCGIWGDAAGCNWLLVHQREARLLAD